MQEEVDENLDTTSTKINANKAEFFRELANFKPTLADIQQKTLYKSGHWQNKQLLHVDKENLIPHDGSPFIPMKVAHRAHTPGIRHFSEELERVRQKIYSSLGQFPPCDH